MGCHFLLLGHGNLLGWSWVYQLSCLRFSLIKGLILLPPSIWNGRAHLPKRDKGSVKSVGMVWPLTSTHSASLNESFWFCPEIPSVLPGSSDSLIGRQEQGLRVWSFSQGDLEASSWSFNSSKRWRGDPWLPLSEALGCWTRILLKIRANADGCHPWKEGWCVRNCKVEFIQPQLNPIL